MVRRQQNADRAVRPPMRSPGTPPLPREVQRLFWIEIAKGLIPAQAAYAVGASQPVGQRWFHNAGGMPPFPLEPLSDRYLSFAEREEIAILHAQGAGVRRIARDIGRDPSTISRELRRNAATRVSASGYRASVAQKPAVVTQSEDEERRARARWLWATTNVRDREHRRLPGNGTAKLDEVISRVLSGGARSGDVAPIQGEISEVRAQEGNMQFRAFFFMWGPHYVCVMSAQKDQPQTPKQWKDLCSARRRAFLKEYGKKPSADL